jgi:hypothetical protein
VRTERLSLSSSAEREDLARHLLCAHERYVAWCILDWASEATAALADMLVASWGPGLSYQPGVPWADPTRPAVLPKTAVSRMLRASMTRVWWSESDAPDRARVMESLEHGCLPLQFTRAGPAESVESLSEVSRAFLLRPDQSGSLVPLSDEELKSRLNTVSRALATGQLDRDLSHEYG